MIQVDSDTVTVRGLLPLVAGAAFALYVFSWLFQSKARVDAPLEGAYKRTGDINSSVSNTYKILQANYAKYRERLFRIPESHGETVILPVKYIEELKALPSDTLSFEEATSDRLLGDYTLMKTSLHGRDGRTFPASINQHLTRSLNSLMKDIHEECSFAFETVIGSCENWTEVNIFEKLVPIVALISGRVFIGQEMNRDPEYMRCIIQYTLEVFTSVGVLQQVNPWLRGLYVRMGWIPQLNQVYASHKSMEKMLTPLIEQRLEQIEAGEKLPDDMITWNMMNSSEKVRRSIKAQAHTQLQASMAAIHTTSMTGSHVLYDLAARPELIEPLREEYLAVMATEPVPYLSKSSTPKLRKLDSFCKESQRVNPLGHMTFNRKVKKNITLHDGTLLPKGTHLAVASAEIAHDGINFPDPDTFDPWRFHKLRQQKGHESRHQFVTTSPDSLPFGYGTHACPGRFFANNELKVIFTYVLAHYDIKMPPGEGRPANIPSVGGFRPDTTKSLLMRKRAEA